MTRSDIHSTFVKRFSRPRSKPVALVSLSDVYSVEKEAGTIFPASFVAFICAHGPVYTPDILDLVVDGQESGSTKFEGWEVAEFFVPSDIPKTHKMYVSGGMDASLIPFASDSSGNVFGFRRTSSNARPDEAAVLFFDHDFCKVSVEAGSFDSWLEHFLPLKPK
jgi:hypothetical protein